MCCGSPSGGCVIRLCGSSAAFTWLRCENMPDTPKPTARPIRWWLDTLRRRAARMYEEKLGLSQPIAWRSSAEQLAAIKFFNAAFRAEESGLRQAHELAH